MGLNFLHEFQYLFAWILPKKIGYLLFIYQQYTYATDICLHSNSQARACH